MSSCSECGSLLVEPPVDEVTREVVCEGCGLVKGTYQLPPAYPPKFSAPMSDHLSIPNETAYCVVCHISLPLKEDRKGRRPSYCKIHRVLELRRQKREFMRRKALERNGVSEGT